MPADITETVAEHSTRLQPSINLHAPVTAYNDMLVAKGLNHFIP